MKRGTIVLTPFPFTDLKGSKVRPVVIISSDTRMGEDIIVSFITSVVDSNNLQNTDLLLKNNDNGFKKTGLKVTSVFKMDKLATLNRNIVLGELGDLSPDLIEQINDKLRIALDLH